MPPLAPRRRALAAACSAAALALPLSLAAAAPDLLVDDLTDERVAEFLFPGSVPNLT